MKASSVIKRLLFSIVPLGVYIASLYQPAFHFEHMESLPGLHILAWGWWGALMFNYAWFANLTFFASVVFYILGRFKPALVLSLASVFLALKAFIAKEWWFTENTGTAITALGTAFYVWLASFIVLTILVSLTLSPDKQRQ